MVDSAAAKEPTAAAGEAQGAAQAVPGMLSAQLLSWSWKYLVPSFGLTLLYINLHFVGRYIAQSRMFSDFGQAFRIGKTKPRAAGGTAMAYAEIIALFFFDGIVAAALLLVAVLLKFMVEALNNTITIIFVGLQTLMDALF
ncbi:MAG: hypothetical protein Q7S96_01260 [bacterium]|nr:hypothetical protein [bacterium]